MTKYIGLILILLGGLALGFGQISYTNTVDDAQLGTIKIQHKEAKNFEMPPLVGIGLMVAGVVCLILRFRSRGSFGEILWIFGGLAGAIIGYTLSYFCQAGAFRFTTSLGQYLEHFSDTIRDSELQSTSIGSLVALMVIGGVIGSILGKKIDAKRPAL